MNEEAKVHAEVSNVQRVEGTTMSSGEAKVRASRPDAHRLIDDERKFHYILDHSIIIGYATSAAGAWDDAAENIARLPYAPPTPVQIAPPSALDASAESNHFAGECGKCGALVIYEMSAGHEANATNPSNLLHEHAWQEERCGQPALRPQREQGQQLATLQADKQFVIDSSNAEFVRLGADVKAQHERAEKYRDALGENAAALAALAALVRDAKLPLLDPALDAQIDAALDKFKALREQKETA